MGIDPNLKKRWSTTVCFLAAFMLLGHCALSHASISVLLEEPYGDLVRLNPAGHSAVYLDHVCAASPTKLRPCHEGEFGVVISRYDDIGGYDWLAIPLLPYLYAVDSPDDIPQTMDRILAGRMRDEYRQMHLQSLAPSLPNGSAPDGNWYELAGAAFDRTIYGFQVDTTAEQDASLIALFNDRKNVERYNGAFRNCADFTRVTINRFYPHAIRRNLIADFGLTSPKAVARGLSRYAAKHPEVNLKVFKVPQVDGWLPRSQKPRGLAESLIKNYGVPLVMISPITTSVILVAYVGNGRFAIPTHAPVLDIRSLALTNTEIAAADRVTRGGSQPPAASTFSEGSAGSEVSSDAADNFLVDSVPVH